MPLTEVMAFTDATYSGRTLALGGSSITSITSKGLNDGLSSNPAGLSVSQKGVQLTHNNGYSLIGYGINVFSATWKIKKVGVGFIYNTEGAKLFEERKGETKENFMGRTKLGFGFGHTVKNNIHYGVGLWHNNDNLRINDNQESLMKNRSSTVADLGLSYIRDTWGIGMAVNTIPVYKLKEEISPTYSFGGFLGKSDNLIFMLDILIKQGSIGGREHLLRGGIEAWFLPNMALRLGIDEASVLTTGLGVSKKNIQIDYAFKVHPVGNTHYITMGYKF